MKIFNKTGLYTGILGRFNKLHECASGRTCGAVWTFERYIDYELKGFIRDTHREISKTECEDLCLSESRFSCRSATYDHLRKECHLSEEDRFTQPGSFVVRQGSDYLENQCESRKCPLLYPGYVCS